MSTDVMQKIRLLKLEKRGRGSRSIQTHVNAHVPTRTNTRGTTYRQEMAINVGVRNGKGASAGHVAFFVVGVAAKVPQLFSSSSIHAGTK